MKAQSEGIQINKYFPFFWAGVSAAAYFIVLIPIHFLFAKQLGYSGWSRIIISLLLGIGQWLLLRTYVPAAGWWFIITFIGGISSFASVFEMREVLRVWPDVALQSFLPSWLQELVYAISGNQYGDIVIFNILLANALFGIRVLRSCLIVFLQWLFLRQKVIAAWKWLVAMPIVIIFAGLVITIFTSTLLRLPAEGYPNIRELDDSLWFKLLFIGLVQLPVLLISGFVMKNLLEKPKQYYEDIVGI